MLIQKIKMNKDLTQVYYVIADGTATEERNRRDASIPAPEFKHDFERLKTLVTEVTNGWTKSDALQKWQVNSVSFKENKNGAIGFTAHISVFFENSNAPLHFNTQPKYALIEGAEKSEFALSGEAVDLLASLKRHAENWMNGVRAQQTLALDEPTKKSKLDVVAVADEIVEESKPRPINRRKVE